MRNGLPTETTPILYSVPEAAAKLRVATKWLYERTRKNAIPYRRLGKYVRFSESDLAAIVASAFIKPNTTISDNINTDVHKTESEGEPKDVASAH